MCAVRSSMRRGSAIGRASSTWMCRLAVMASPRLGMCWERVLLDRELFSEPVRGVAEANGATSIFVIWDLVLILATFLHIVAGPGLDPIGAVDLLSHGTLLCHGINDTIVVIGGEGRSLIK